MRSPLLVFLLAPLLAAAAPLVFEVPEGTVELEVRHANLTPGNVLDWGLWSPGGIRRRPWWGFTRPRGAIWPGPLTPGTWQVVVGKAKVRARPAQYRVEIELRTEPTLAPASSSAKGRSPSGTGSSTRA